jgi:phospho-N-acetylmuramoyl-pentapeptide-transferase
MPLELITFILFFLLSTGITFALIVLLSQYGVGSIIRAQGPASHVEKKDTPALAGIGFIVLFILFILAAYLMQQLSKPIVAIILVATGFGLLGLVDDLLKQFLRASSGFKARYRLAIQLLLALAFALWLSRYVPGHGIAIPGYPKVWIPGYWLVAIDVLLLAGFVNAFNFTDGLDGLAAGLGIICALVLGLLAWMSNLNTYLDTFPENAALIPIVAFVGIAGGFLVFNWQPARIFMGDGGAYALGGFIGAYAITTGLHIGLIVAGLVFAVELFSVIIQVLSFRTTGRRVFAMTPLHHAFELKGHSEASIVRGFWVAGAICALACYFLFTQVGWRFT